MTKPKRFEMEKLRNHLDRIEPEALAPLLKAALTHLLKDLTDNCRTLVEVKASSYIVGGLSNEISKQLCPRSLEKIKGRLREKIKRAKPSSQDKKSRGFEALEKDFHFVLELLEKTTQTSGPSIDPKAGEKFWLRFRRQKLPPLHVF